MTAADAAFAVSQTLRVARNGELVGREPASLRFCARHTAIVGIAQADADPADPAFVEALASRIRHAQHKGGPDVADEVAREFLAMFRTVFAEQAKAIDRLAQDQAEAVAS